MGNGWPSVWMDGGLLPAAKTLPRWTSLSSRPARIPKKLPLSGSRWTTFTWVGRSFFDVKVPLPGRTAHQSMSEENDHGTTQFDYVGQRTPGSANQSGSPAR